MKFLQLANHINGIGIQAQDGHIGKLADLCFDDRSWKVKYLVVDVGTWFPDRKVLLSPQAVETSEWDDQTIILNVTKQKVRESPEIDTDMPVSRQHELLLHKHYGWSLIFSGDAFAGEPVFNSPLTSILMDDEDVTMNSDGTEFDPHLRSTKSLSNTDLYGYDGLIGKVHDFAFDADTWTLHFIVVATGRGRQVLVRSSSVLEIDEPDKTVRTDLSVWRIRELPQFSEGRVSILCLGQEELAGVAQPK